MISYWLMKSEPSSYSIDDLKSDKNTYWNGVRNFQARNFMRDTMRVGDQVLFYHSSAEPPGVAGVAQVSRAGYPDFTAWDKKDSHYDPKSKQENPLWYMVDIAFVEKFPRLIPLETLKANEKLLKGMPVLKKGMRLSVQPVEKKHFEWVRRCGKK